MVAIIEGFEHVPGRHCASTAFRDAAQFIGLDWSEALVFGLGSGLGFYLLESDGMSPSRMFAGRTGPFEANFAEHTGLEFDEQSVADPERAADAIAALIDAGEPVLIKSDIRYLPYYQTETAFNGHKVVLAGRDADRDTFLVADTHFDELQTVTRADLLRTLSSDGPPTFWTDCMFAPLRRSDQERPLDAAIQLAIETNAKRMLDDPSDFGGLAALTRLGERLPGYRDLFDASWIAKFGYQVIEKRGTGGGCFRRLYAEFLGEAVGLARAPAVWAEQMTAIALRWSALASALKAAAEGDDNGWASAARTASEIAKEERRFFEGVLR